MDEDRNTPSTKGDIADLRNELRADMKAMEARLGERHEIMRSEMKHRSADLKKTIHDAQTALIEAFYSFR